MTPEAQAQEIIVRSCSRYYFSKGGSVQNIELLETDIAAALRTARREVWEQASRYFDALEQEDNPLTAGQLIVHFQEWAGDQIKAQEASHERAAVRDV